MADDEPITGPGRDLLAAYKLHTGPPPAAARRIAAALREEVVPPPIDLRRRRRWIAATIVLAAAAAVLLALQVAPATRHAARVDEAAKYEQTPVDPARAHMRSTAADVDPAADSAAPPSSTPPPRPRRDAPTVPTPRAPSLADEMQAMRAAQAALAAGDPDEALARLDAYAQQFPAGHLREEHAALRAIALCTRRPADPAAAAFLAAHPQSVFAARVRGACAIAGNETPDARTSTAPEPLP